MGTKVTGLSEFQRSLKELGERIDAVSGENHVPMTELLTPDFLATCSTFSSAQEMFDRSGFKVESQEDFAAIPDDEWDAFIPANTSYFSWRCLKS